MPKYNGHRSWNAWNVSLWINNDPHTYSLARELVDKYGRVLGSRYLFEDYLKGRRTPDGGIYNLTTVREALRGY